MNLAIVKGAKEALGQRGILFLTLAYKVVVFLILFLILSEYRESNELRRQILKEAKSFNSKMLQFNLTAKNINQYENIISARYKHGANIKLAEGVESEIHSKYRAIQGIGGR